MTKAALWVATERAGWSVVAWCAAVGIARATYYNLPAEMQPFSVKVLGRRIIHEPPPAWLARIAAQQQAA